MKRLAEVTVKKLAHIPDDNKCYRVSFRYVDVGNITYAVTHDLTPKSMRNLDYRLTELKFSIEITYLYSAAIIHYNPK